MNNYFTIMVIPEKEKGVKSFRIPRIFFHAAIFILVISIFLLIILSYDYWKILRQVYENKHLTIENRQLKEQIQLFQMKINTLTEDIERINVFEKKLRIITGLDNVDMSQSILPGDRDEDTNQSVEPSPSPLSGKQRLPQSVDLKTPRAENVEEEKAYRELKALYEQKIATAFGLQTGYAYTKEWSELTKRSFDMASQYARFDYSFNMLNSDVRKLETDIHELDEFLLDRDSFIRSTPTLLPARGWITSYYGERKSPYSGRKKMHEGLDIGGKLGSPILAPADGVVTFSGKKAGFGIIVQVDHGYGVETIFAHADSSAVKLGQKVKRGELIARLGSSGYSTGPHCHYEIRVNGIPVDPLYYILD